MEPTIIKFVVDSDTNTVWSDHFGVTVSCSYDVNQIIDINCSENKIFILHHETLYAYDMNGTKASELLIGERLFISAVLSGFVYVMDGENIEDSFIYDEELNCIQELIKYEPLVINYKESMLAMDVRTRKIMDESEGATEVVVADIVRDMFEAGGTRIIYIYPKICRR